MERRTYTVAETAEILGVSTDVVYRMKNDGILPAVKTLFSETGCAGDGR